MATFVTSPSTLVSRSFNLPHHNCPTSRPRTSQNPRRSILQAKAASNPDPQTDEKSTGVVDVKIGDEEKKVELNGEGGEGMGLTSLGDVGEIINVVKDYEVGDIRLVQDGVAIEITMPGGRGFVDGVLREAPLEEVGVADVREEVVEEKEEKVGAEVGNGDDVVEAEVGGTDGGMKSRGNGNGYVQAAVKEVVKSEEKESGVVEEEDDGEDDANKIFASDFVVMSNRVGYFFSGQKNKPPLVNVGEHIEYNKPVCVIEQLGQQYVYKTEVSGTVVNIFVEDGDPVEYDQKIMVIRPD
eukprot:Plantae.Rhodophyta-Hildenbrandia_rubra.ctg3651.p4 GENE.Plantae.Rhodophyta-Hildenbrandia_rubra.ctg3651~~Plantae.Rhodophyta-Hildenbrandia_rubra.ctg3651.p4  ORF type:complete len:297 (+),score=91.02 Plantae.Rhodophyta-Hildenbrandia_rubra.ctg3651:4367-5257(+)